MVLFALVIALLFMAYYNTKECIEYDKSNPDVCLNYVTGADKMAAFVTQIMESWVIWLIVVIPIILLVVYVVAEYFGIWGSMKLARKFDPKKRIPQEQREQIARLKLEKEYLIGEKFGKPLIMVSDYITAERKDARPMTLMLFTTSQAYAQGRIKEDELETKERFYVAMDCVLGEPYTQDYLNDKKFERAKKEFRNDWLLSIERPKESKYDQIVKESVARYTGEKIAKTETLQESETDEKDNDQG